VHVTPSYSDYLTEHILTTAEDVTKVDTPAFHIVLDPDSDHLLFNFSPNSDISKTLADVRVFVDHIPIAHPKRAEALQMIQSWLDQLLDSVSEVLWQLALLDQIIRLDRELLPQDFSQGTSAKWLGAALHLANSLSKRGELTPGNLGETYISEAIDIEKSRLAHLDPNNQEFAIASANIAMSLKALYDRTGNLAVLDEAITLQRQALLISTLEHPVWVKISDNLTNSLLAQLEVTENLNALNEAVVVARAALERCPPEDPLYGRRMRNLSAHLERVYSQTGDTKSLEESTTLLRQVLTVTRKTNPDRALICSTLAVSLNLHYRNTSDPSFLAEAILFGEEALSLMTREAPGWSTVVASVAISYRQWAQMKQGDPTAVLNLTKAIDLQREVMAHHSPINSADQFEDLHQLGVSLFAYYQQTSELGPLRESISLQRQALALCPDGHHALAILYLGLAFSLLALSKFEKRDICIAEAIDFAYRGLNKGHSRSRWRAYLMLCQAYRIQRTPFFDLNKACTYIQKCFASDELVDDIPLMIIYALENLREMWPNNSLEAHTFCREMLPTYTTIVHLLPVVVGFALDRSAQLQLLRSYGYVGAEAFLLAVLANEAARGLELLEVAQGLVWTQALNQRNPDLKKLPAPVAAELGRLLQTSHAPTDSLSADNILTARDHRHHENRRIQSILHDLRSQPGFERFMLGHSADELVEAARDHSVVLLTGSRSYSVAVIICPRKAGRRDISFIPLSQHLSNSDIDQLVSAATEATPGKRGSVSASDENVGGDDEIRAMAIKRKLTDTMHVKLAVLWRKLVKPILQHPSLHLSVSVHRPV
jgi:tetratricopeptide (TPR) repeat protein